MNRKIRILFIAKSYPYWGGVERWLSILVNGLLERGMEVDVALLGGARFNHPEKFAESLGISRYKSLNVVSGSDDYKDFVIKKEINRVQPDIVVPLLTADGLKVACESKDSYGYKVVYPVHEYSVGVVDDLLEFSASIDKVVCVEKLSTLFLPSFLNLERDLFFEIPACYDPLVKTVKTIKQRTSPIIRLGYCGRFGNRQKNEDFLIQVCQYLKKSNINFSLNIVGANKLEAKAKLTFLATDEIQYSGELTTSQMKVFYENIDCLLITSTWETGPLIAWEAMCNRVLLITSDYLGLKAQDFLKDKINCLCFSLNDPVSCVNKIQLVITGSKLRNRLIEQAYADISEQRSGKIMIDRWFEFLQQVYAQVDKDTRRFTVQKISFLHNIKMVFLEYLRIIFFKKYRPASLQAEWPIHVVMKEIIEQDKVLQAMRDFENSKFS